MDPLTQGVVGVVATQQTAVRKHFLTASCLGLLSGMAPDLDILIRSSADPLLALEYHRQFTHSLFFIPIGGLICAAVLYYLFAKRQGLSFKRSYFYCVLGYGTHGLLDSCTTYGTQLFWPLTDMRVAWHTVSIIDPLYTLPLLLLVVIAAVKRSRRVAHLALAWIVLYSIIGVVQRERAETAGLQLALERGHQPVTLEAKPSFANLIVWKIVYSTGTHYYVDAVRVGLRKTIYEGSSIAKLNVESSFPWLDLNSQQAVDIERFRWFSNGYLAVSPENPNRIIDMRYSLLPNQINGLWGIELDPKQDKNAHVEFVPNRRRSSNSFNQLWNMITGNQ